MILYFQRYIKQLTVMFFLLQISPIISKMAYFITNEGHGDETDIVVNQHSSAKRRYCL